MNNKKIYSFKAVGGGRCVSGRVCAQNMSDATDQVVGRIKGYGRMSINVAELRNQMQAMKEWEAQEQSHD